MYLVQKFGGTSVGTAQRIKDLRHLTVNDTPKIVVLSAMSGTTNALVQICDALYNRDNTTAVKLITDLRANYEKVIRKLFETPGGKEKGKQLIENHFSYIHAFTLDMFTANEEKAILAQGELLSTALFHFYLEEQEIDSELLPALNFMKIDENEEPDLGYIGKYIQEEIAKHPGKKLFITQGYICRNRFGE